MNLDPFYPQTLREEELNALAANIEPKVYEYGFLLR